jgi:Mg-chelatase subunit ChlD
VLVPATLIAGKYSGGTPIGAAIRDAAHYLDNNAREDTRKVMIVMSDGDATHPVGNTSGYALSMTDYAVGLGITVHAVSLGNSANTSLMMAIADAGRGTHFAASGTGSQLAISLNTTFRSLAYDIKRTTVVE